MNNMRLNQYQWNSDEDFLGRGAFAEVFRAHTDKGNSFVALKIATEASLENNDGSGVGSGSLRSKYRLEEEYAKGKDLSHTHIIRYWDLEYLVHTDHMNRKSRHAVLIMEYADKGSLEQRLFAGAKLPIDEAWRVAKEILNGLSYLHSQFVVHRDLKPANVLFKTGKLGVDVVKLTDFGISRDLLTQQNGDAPSSTTGVGTSLYMAPEQFLKKKYGLDGSISPRTDFWAWGVIFYRMLTGRLPFGHEAADYEALQQNITQTEPDFRDIPSSFESILRACFRKNAAERPANEKEILDLFGQREKSANQFHSETQIEKKIEKKRPVELTADVTRILPPPVAAKKPVQSQKGKSITKKPINTRPVIIAGVIIVLAGALWFALSHISKQKLSETKHPNSQDTSVISVVDLKGLSAAPVNPKLKAALDIKDGNINSYIAAIDDNGHWELKKTDLNNKAVFNQSTTDDQKNELKQLINNLLEYGVQQNNIHFIYRDSLYNNRQCRQVIATLKQMGFYSTAVSDTQAISDIRSAALPKAYGSQGLVLDMEKGYTKLIGLTDDKQVIGCTAYGIDYYNQGVSDGSADSNVNEMVKEMRARVSTLHQKVCFVIGEGAAFIPKTHHDDRFTRMDSPGGYQSTAKNEDEDARAATTIYGSVYRNTGCKQFIHDWQSSAAVGFLLRAR